MISRLIIIDRNFACKITSIGGTYGAQRLLRVYYKQPVALQRECNNSRLQLNFLLKTPQRGRLFVEKPRKKLLRAVGTALGILLH